MTGFFSGKCAAKNWLCQHASKQLSGSNGRPDKKNFSDRFYRFLLLVPCHQNCAENIHADGMATGIWPIALHGLALLLKTILLLRWILRIISANASGNICRINLPVKYPPTYYARYKWVVTAASSDGYFQVNPSGKTSARFNP